MLLPYFSASRVALPQRCAAGFTLLEFSLSLGLGLWLLSLLVTAWLTMSHQWRWQQYTWQQLLQQQWLAAYLSQELRMAYPRVCGTVVGLTPVLPSIRQAQVLQYQQCIDQQLSVVAVFARHGTLYRRVDGQRALQLLEGVSTFRAEQLTRPPQPVVWRVWLGLAHQPAWPLDIAVRGM